MSYESRITDGVQQAFVRARPNEITAEVDELKWIIFSDHHRAARGPDDRFVRAEPAYNAALGYYVETGHTLVLLGDVEELWARSPQEVMRAYPYTLELESEFFVRSRYIRFFGNHDAEWSLDGRTRDHLWPFLPGLEVLESLRVRLTSGARDVGTLFLAHGHHGSTFSDRHQGIARFAVRNIWRPAQRIVRRPWSTPAADFELRERHDRALYGWAAEHEGVVLIAGHTHRPVFMSESLTRKVSRELVAARSELAALRSGEFDPASAPPAEELRQRVAVLRAQLEWLRTGSSNGEGPHRMTGARMKPCYFNTGCCCFPDGDITGIEIADGQIRLVRWPDPQGRPRPRVLATADLRRDVLWRPKSPTAPVKTSGAGLS